MKYHLAKQLAKVTALFLAAFIFTIRLLPLSFFLNAINVFLKFWLSDWFYLLNAIANELTIAGGRLNEAELCRFFRFIDC